MMTRWTHQAERILIIALDDRIDGGHASAGRGQGNIEGIGTDDSVGVEHAAAMLGHLFGGLDLFGRMKLSNRFFSERLVSACLAFLDQAGLF